MNNLISQTQNNKLLRVIDANYNRATEGVRVVEDICRFVLDEPKSALTLKHLRGDLFKATKKSPSLIKARDSRQDVGRKMFSKSESQRDSLSEICKSNFKRAQEAVRCLEEFSKLVYPEVTTAYKEIRYQLYDLERSLAVKVLKYEKMNFDLYVVTDPKYNPLKTAKRALSRGVKALQLRDKAISKEGYLKLAIKLAASCKKHKCTFIVNDYWDLVKRVGADGVHLGQEDLKIFDLAKVRRAIGDDKLIGISTHDFKQAKKAVQLGADYISVGPIFATPSKPNTRPVGLKLLSRVLANTKIPVVAIGGINSSNIDLVRKIGCQRQAVIRAASEL